MIVINTNELNDKSKSSISTPTSSASSFDNNNNKSKSKSKSEHFYQVSLAQAELDDDEIELIDNNTRSKLNYDAEVVEFVDEEVQEEEEEEEEEDSVNSASCEHSSKSEKSINSIQTTKRSKSPITTSTNTTTTTGVGGNNLNSLKQIFSPNSVKQLPVQCKVLAEEKLSNEAKEYWATIDFYNNSKMIFNKRYKSVKLKREKLNNEIKERKMKIKEVKVESRDVEQNEQAKTQEASQLCSCVKCSIIYHEALIKGITNINEILCTKCHSKLTNCKCCNTINTSTSKPMTNSNKNELTTQFDEKLFSIKSELVNLSETSLDVFQLLLQLSDTMLDLNNQLSSSTNANQLFLLNSNLNLNQNLLLNTSNSFLNESIACIEEEDEPDNELKQNPENLLPNLKNLKKSHKIEDFLQKTFYSTQTSPNTTTTTTSQSSNANCSQNSNKQLNNSISNIINSINNRSKNQIDSNCKKHFSLSSNRSGLTSPTTGLNQTLSPQMNRAKTIKSCDNTQSSNLIENIYDKTSVTQFVDSLLNTKIENDELSRTSSGFYSSSSLLTIINSKEETNVQEQNYSSLKINNSNVPLKLTTTTTSHILARQAQFNNNNNSNSNSNQYNANKMVLTPIKTSISTTSTSSGCGGSSSLSSSSNIDLTSLPSTCSSSINIGDDLNKISHEQELNNSYRNSTASTASNESNLIETKTNLLSPTHNNINNNNNNQSKSIYSTQTRSNSVNLNRFINSSPSKVLNQTNLSYSAGSSTSAQAARKPSFKFENSTILNRVQNMNLNNKLLKFNNVGEEERLEINKRSSLNRESYYTINNGESARLIRRQQSVLSRPTTVTQKNLLGSKFGEVRSNHQISLDSGIYLPTENDENLAVVI